MPDGSVPIEAQMEFSDADFAIVSHTDQSKKLKWDVSGIPTGTTVTTGYREVLRAARTYYVGANIPAPTITIASPAVVSSTAHGLSAGDAVVFNVPLNTKAATISAANPAVVTMANSFVAGQPVKFSSTGSLPYGIVPGTTYYVISAGLSGSQFEISATVGGAAISTAAPTAGFTNGSANITITTANTYYSVGQTIRFATTGTLPTNFATATDYFIVSATSTLITVSATNGGSAIVAGSAGTGTQTALQAGTHYTSTTGALPTGITEGTVYYVSTANLAANSFQISDTAAHGIAGTNHINTSGSVTGSPIYGAYTGADTNSGLAQTRAGAFLTIQKAYAVISANIDVAGATITVRVTAGTYSDGISVAVPWLGGGIIDIVGDTSTPDNVLISTTSAHCLNITTTLVGILKLRGFKIQSATSGSGLRHVGGGIFQYGSINFGATADHHIYIDSSLASVTASAANTISGSASFHMIVLTGFGKMSDFAITVVGVPAFSGQFANCQRAGYLASEATTITGSATGARYSVTTNGIINTGGGGASYFPGNAAGSTATGGQYV